MRSVAGEAQVENIWTTETRNETRTRETLVITRKALSQIDTRHVLVAKRKLPSMPFVWSHAHKASHKSHVRIFVEMSLARASYTSAVSKCHHKMSFSRPCKRHPKIVLT